MAQYSLSRLTPGYLKLWRTIKVTNPTAARRAAQRILRGKKAYKHVEAMTGVKWSVVGAIHYRESNCDFDTWLHNGDPMRYRNGTPRRTVNVPRNRPPDPSVDWFQGAYDALVTVEHLDGIKNYGPEHFAYASEKMNGFGYRNPRINIPSPYLWGGSNHQKRGKYVSDGHYDPSHWDTQLGCMTVLKALIEMDPEADFDKPAVPEAIEIPDLIDESKAVRDEAGVPVNPPASPRATDQSESVAKNRIKTSKTLLGGLLQYITSAGAAMLAFIQGMPPWLIAAILVAALIALAIVVWGRVDVQRLVNHLSPDDMTEDDPDV